MIAAAGIALAGLAAWQAVPDRGGQTIARDSFAAFPRDLGDWAQVGRTQRLDESVARTLAADDYHSVILARTATEPDVGLFMAWYQDQSAGGVHSPEICLPGSGWEIRLAGSAPDIAAEMGTETAFNINRAIIQRGRDPDDGLLLVPAGRATHRLGLRGQVLPDGGWDPHGLHGWGPDPPDDPDPRGRERCTGRGTTTGCFGRTIAAACLASFQSDPGSAFA